MKERRKHAIDEATMRRIDAAAAHVLSAHPEIAAAYLHGSAARGEPAGDIDIAVLVQGPELAFRELEAIAEELRAAGFPHEPDIDLRSLTGTSPRFRANVLRDGRLIHEGDRARRLAFEARAMSEWLDFKPVWERMRRNLFDRWTHG